MYKLTWTIAQVFQYVLLWLHALASFVRVAWLHSLNLMLAGILRSHAAPFKGTWRLITTAQRVRCSHCWIFRLLWTQYQARHLFIYYFEFLQTWLIWQQCLPEGGGGLEGRWGVSCGFLLSSTPTKSPHGMGSCQTAVSGHPPNHICSLNSCR